MKTFVRRASGAELSADFTEKETNERACSSRLRFAFSVYATIFLPCLRIFLEKRNEGETERGSLELQRKYDAGASGVQAERME